MQLARKQESATVAQELGTVVAVEAADGGDRFAVVLNAGRVVARRAASCLLVPRAGDRVLVALASEGDYVLAVLSRDHAAPAQLVVDGDAQLRARGKLTLSGDEGMTLLSKLRLSVAARALDVQAGESSFVAGSLKTIVGTVDAVLDRLSQKMKRAYRFVEETEHVRAHTLDYAARENVRMHGKNAIVTAQQLVKMDGAQIHMG
jgi:hypothetical protein